MLEYFRRKIKWRQYVHQRAGDEENQLSMGLEVTYIADSRRRDKRDERVDGGSRKESISRFGMFGPIGVCQHVPDVFDRRASNSFLPAFCHPLI